MGVGRVRQAGVRAQHEPRQLLFLLLSGREDCGRLRLLQGSGFRAQVTAPKCPPARAPHPRPGCATW